MLSIRKKERNEKRLKFDKRSENFMSSFSGPVMPQNVESIFILSLFVCCVSPILEFFSLNSVTLMCIITHRHYGYIYVAHTQL